MITPLRNVLEEIRDKVQAGLSPNEAAVLRGNLTQTANRVGQLERAHYAVVVEALKDQPPPVPVPPEPTNVVELPRRPIPVRFIGETT